MLVLGSRPLSFWLGIGAAGSTNLEGNWFDRLLYVGLIFAAICILSQRQISWGTLIAQNKALLLFYLFLLATQHLANLKNNLRLFIKRDFHMAAGEKTCSKLFTGRLWTTNHCRFPTVKSCSVAI